MLAVYTVRFDLVPDVQRKLDKQLGNGTITQTEYDGRMEVIVAELEKSLRRVVGQLATDSGMIVEVRT